MSLRSWIARTLRAHAKPFHTYNTIRVSRSAVLHNFDLFQQLSPGGDVIPVLKANAYGHGLEQIATILKERRFPYLAVDGYFEALRIRETSSQPVLVMGAIHASNYAKMHTKGFAFVVSDATAIECLGALNKDINVHVELETGMGRHGVRLDELNQLLTVLKRFPRLNVEGVMTHLADADNAQSTSYVASQTRKFDAAVEQIRAAGFTPRYLHIAQSAGSVKVHSTYANTLRVGIALYGISPLEPHDAANNQLSALQPALTLTSTIAKVLHVDAGDSIGYGCTFVAQRPTTIGVLPLGYYEGIPRQLSNAGKAKYGNCSLPFAGRVCMNHIMLDLTDSTAKAGDVVTLISDHPDDAMSIQSLCARHELFAYVLLVGLNQNIRRVIVD